MTEKYTEYNMGSVIEHVNFENNEEGNCRWTNLQIIYADEKNQDSLVNEIAYALARIRFGKDSDHYKWWDETVRGLKTNNATEKKILTAFMRPSLGTEALPLPDDQIQGVIAETLWYEIASNTESLEGLPIRMEEPHFTITEPGGDGLAVYTTQKEKYLFRLWEVKKHNSSETATTKITEASSQLDLKGAEYLAKWSKVSQEVDHANPGLSFFYAKLVDMWIQGSSEARAGISVSKNDKSAICSTPITVAKKQLERFVNDEQVEVMIITIPEFNSIAEGVIKVIWSGI